MASSALDQASGSLRLTDEDIEHECRNASGSTVSTLTIVTESFEYPNSSCSFCNGYYGPCFEEPVCATCHAFLFPGDFGNPEAVALFSEKTDDGDSGNDEPTDLYYGQERRQSQQSQQNQQNQQNQQQAHPSAPRSLPTPSRPQSLGQRLGMLCDPRPPDDVVPRVVECLPPEVLLAVFSYLDDISLWSVGNVCKRWRHLVRTHVTQEQWRISTLRRWPLFEPLRAVTDWFDAYSVLISSCPCKTCLQQMALQVQPPGEENSWRRNRLRNELKSLRTDPPEGIRATPLDQKCCHWQASITGPAGSVYEGGLFYLYLQVPYSYPMCPPVVRFLTRIFHPNVSRHGDVGIDSIQHNWSLALTISKVLISVQSLLTDPYCPVCMEPAAGDMYLNDRDKFETVARAWTWRYAMPDILPRRMSP